MKAQQDRERLNSAPIAADLPEGLEFSQVSQVLGWCVSLAYAAHVPVGVRRTRIYPQQVQQLKKESRKHCLNLTLAVVDPQGANVDVSQVCEVLVFCAYQAGVSRALEGESRMKISQQRVQQLRELICRHC